MKSKTAASKKEAYKATKKEEVVAFFNRDPPPTEEDKCSNRKVAKWRKKCRALDVDNEYYDLREVAKWAVKNNKISKERFRELLPDEELPEVTPNEQLVDDASESGDVGYLPPPSEISEDEEALDELVEGLFEDSVENDDVDYQPEPPAVEEPVAVPTVSPVDNTREEDLHEPVIQSGGEPLSVPITPKQQNGTQKLPATAGIGRLKLTIPVPGPSPRASIRFLVMLPIFIFLAALWLRNRDAASGVAAVVFAVGVFFDFIWTEGRKAWRVSLLKYKNEGELRAIAADSGIPNYSTLPNSDLIPAIKASYNKGVLEAWRWKRTQLYLVVFALLGVIPTYLLMGHLYPLPEDTPPDIKLAWLVKDDGKIVPSELESVRLSANAYRILEEGMIVPVRLAVKNNELQALEVVSVTLEYPHTLNVEGRGEPRFRKEGSTLILEHPIGNLEPTDVFTPLVAADEIRIHKVFERRWDVTTDSEGVPFLQLTISVRDEYRDGIEFQVSVYARDRPIVKRPIIFRVGGPDKVLTDMLGTELELVTDQDHMTFQAMSGDAKVLSTDSGPITGSDALYEYSMVEADGSIQQRISVGGVLRKVVVDMDKDGDMDYVLLDRSGDGTPDEKHSYRKQPDMIDWAAGTE